MKAMVLRRLCDVRHEREPLAFAEFLAFAVGAGIRPEVETYPLAGANRALLDLKERRIRGAKVLQL